MAYRMSLASPVRMRGPLRGKEVLGYRLPYSLYRDPLYRPPPVSLSPFDLRPYCPGGLGRSAHKGEYVFFSDGPAGASATDLINIDPELFRGGPRLRGRSN